MDEKEYRALVSFMTSAPPSGSHLERLIKAVYEDKNIADTYPLEEMHLFFEMLFRDGDKLDPEALLSFLEEEMQKVRRIAPNQMLIYAMTVGLIRIGILVKDIEESAYMVCRDGWGGKGTFASCLNLTLGQAREPLYLSEREVALALAASIRTYENSNGQRAVHLKKIEKTSQGYVMMHLDIPQDM